MDVEYKPIDKFECFKNNIEDKLPEFWDTVKKTIKEKSPKEVGVILDDLHIGICIETCPQNSSLQQQTPAFLVVAHTCKEDVEWKVIECASNASSKPIYYSNTKENNQMEQLVAGFKVQWRFSYKGSVCQREKANVIIDIIGDLLKRRFNDFNMFFNPDDLFSAQSNEEYDFMAEYQAKVFQKYNLPDVDFIQSVSLQHYEKNEVNAVMFFVSKKHGLASECESLFETEINMEAENGEYDRINKVRKMLEMCGDKANGLVVEETGKHIIIGLASQEIIKKYMKEPIIAVRFARRGEWCVLCGEECLLFCKDGMFFVEKAHQEEQWREKLCAIVGEDKVDKFVEIINELNNQKHGALMIIAEDAKNEADRLCKKFKRGVLIAAMDLEGENCLNVLGGMSSIDGAILVDFDGVCHGFSVILDGVAKRTGNLGRGSRYNSAVTYIAGEPERCAVIVSEDKEKGIQIITKQDLEMKESV